MTFCLYSSIHRTHFFFNFESRFKYVNKSCFCKKPVSAHLTMSQLLLENAKIIFFEALNNYKLSHNNQNMQHS